MRGPEDPLSRLPCRISSKRVSSQDPLLRKFGNLASTASILPKFQLTSPQIWKFSAHNPGGALNFGLRAMCHQRDPTFSLAFTKIPPFLLTFTQWPPITERPWYIFVNQRPLIFAFYSQTSDRQFSARNWIFSTNLTKCLEIFGHFGLERPLVLMHFTERPPYFCMLCHWKALFWHRPNLSPKDPYIREVLGGMAFVRHFHMWVTPRGAHKPQISLEIFSSQAPKFGNFGSQARPLRLSEVSISSQAPPFGNPGRTQYFFPYYSTVLHIPT